MHLIFLMIKEDKIRILNRIFAQRSGENFLPKFLESEKAIDFVFQNGFETGNLSDFARSIIKIYDEETDLEFIDLSDDYFDPLFKLDEISDAVKRLSGCKRPILVVSGLDHASKGRALRWSEKKRKEYFSNLDIVEARILRYQFSIPQIEIIFI